MAEGPLPVSRRPMSDIAIREDAATMNPRHVRLLFVPLLIPSESLMSSSVLQLPAIGNDECNGRSAPAAVRVRAVLVRDGRVAPSKGIPPCRAQLPTMRTAFPVTRQ